MWNRARFKDDLSQQFIRGKQLDPQAQTDKNILAAATLAVQDKSLRNFETDDPVLESVVRDKQLQGRIVQVEERVGLYESDEAAYGIGSCEEKAITVC